MSYTYSKIATVEVGSGGVSSINFLAIPQNYTDLLIKTSVRSTVAANYTGFFVSYNSLTTSFSMKQLYGYNGSAGGDSRTDGRMLDINAANNTANTFTSIDMYIPNYSGSTYKGFSLDSGMEGNAATIQTEITSGFWANSSPITSIALTPESGSWAQYSTATLYGIKAEL